MFSGMTDFEKKNASKNLYQEVFLEYTALLMNSMARYSNTSEERREIRRKLVADPRFIETLDEVELMVDDKVLGGKEMAAQWICANFRLAIKEARMRIKEKNMPTCAEAPTFGMF
jgi:hypothetical protein